MTNTSTEQSNPAESQPVQLPALIEKAKNQITQFLKEGANILCPLNATDPPPGFIPQVVAVYLDPDPNKKDVYKDEFGNLVPSAVGLRKLSTVQGVSWDLKESRRMDDGSDPNVCEYRMVAMVADYQGNITKVPGDYRMDMAVIEAETRVKHPDWNEGKILKELLFKRHYILQLAQTGAMNRAIRLRGLRTTYRPEELKKPFVDVRLVPIDGNRHKAEQAYDHLYGKPEPRQEQSRPPEDIVIDAKATRQDHPQQETGYEEEQESLFKNGGTQTLESCLLDFSNCDREQKVLSIRQVATTKCFPLPKGFENWNNEKLAPFFRMLLEIPEPAKEGGK